MAKQMRRVEKRYVPQQESYRNLPGLRPQATPVDVTAEPVADPAGQKLRELAEGLSSLNSGLTNFFKMEKSFEETNRVEARVRAQMGLPYDPDGKGHLDYGVAQGYEEGKGILDGQEAMLEVQRRLADENYGITEDNISDPSAVRRHVDSTVANVMQTISRTSPSRAYLEGLAPLVTQAKIEARVMGEKVWRAKEKEARAGNFSKFVNNHVDNFLLKDMRGDILQGIKPSPEKLRNTFAELTRIGRDQYNFDRNTATVYILENIQSSLVRDMTKALSRDGSFAEIQDLEDISQVLLEAMDSPDAAGIRLKDLKEPEVMRSVENIRATAENFNNRAMAVRAKNQELEMDKVLGGGVQILLKGGTMDEVLKYATVAFDKGSLEGDSMISVMGQLNQSFNAGIFQMLPKEEVQGYLADALSGKMSNADLVNLQFTKNLPKSTFALLNDAISSRRSDVSFSNTMMNAGYATSEHAMRMQDLETKRITVENTSMIKAEVSKYAPEKQNFILKVLDGAFPNLSDPLGDGDIAVLAKEASDAYDKGDKSYEDTKAEWEKAYGIRDTNGLMNPVYNQYKEPIEEVANVARGLAIGPKFNPNWRKDVARNKSLYDARKARRSSAGAPTVPPSIYNPK